MNNILNSNCTLERINQSLDSALNVMKSISFEYDQIEYFNSIYSKLDEIMRNDENFLKDAECLKIYEVYEKFLNENINFKNEGKTKLSFITPNSVLLIKCPSIFASYHFLIAVIDNTRTFVDTYQSFGSSYRLRNIRIPFIFFEKSINFLNNINKGTNRNLFYNKLPKLIKIEQDLYGININEYQNKLLQQYENEDEDEHMNDLTDKQSEILNRLGIDPLIAENLERNYELINGDSVEIYLYLPKSYGGATKKKNSKKRKYKKNSRKIKKITKSKKRLL